MAYKNAEIKFKVVDPDYSGLKVLELSYGECRNVYGQKQVYTMDILLPEQNEGRSYPIVYFLHGGGFTEPCDRKQTYISLFAQELCRQGYAVIAADYPVCKTGEDLDRLGEPFVCSTAAKAIWESVRFCRENKETYSLDTENIFMMGGSAGSMVSFYVVNLHPEAFRGLINLWGIPDPLPNVEKFPPVLSVHGDQDELVPYAREDTLDQELTKANVPHELITLPGCGHTPVRQRENYLPQMLSFLRRNTKGPAHEN